MLLYSVAILLGASASRNTNTNLAAALTNLFAVIAPAVVAIPIVTKKTFHSQKFGILMAILGGVAIGFFVMAMNKSYSVNKVGIVVPIVFGGGILLSTIASYFVFNEKIGLGEGIGLALVLIGLAVLLYARATA